MLLGNNSQLYRRSNNRYLVAVAIKGETIAPLHVTTVVIGSGNCTKNLKSEVGFEPVTLRLHVNPLSIMLPIVC